MTIYITEDVQQLSGLLGLLAALLGQVEEYNNLEINITLHTKLTSTMNKT